jgi:flavin-dependent dehydrogenase
VKSTLDPLHEGGHVVIIGGGPGGAACALALSRLTNQMGKHLKITILEGKQFAGEHHYNQCVGVLSLPLPSLLEDQLGVPFPYHLSQGEIQGYILHTDKEQIKMTGDEKTSIALRRVQFDAYMLEMVKQRGIRIIPARAVDLEFHSENVLVYTESKPQECDVVVGAFGMDEGSAALFARHTAYRPPQALSSVVTKYHPDSKRMAAFGPYIHAFLPSHPRIEFGAITPKSKHLTINIAGRSVDVTLMQVFMNQLAVRSVLPNLTHAGQYNQNDLRFFKGRFPFSLAQHYYGDRYVMVGDAAGLVRAFKGKGVTSAVLTGIRAAETILKAGFTRQAFHNHYRLANQDITHDLPYGRGMRLLTILLSRYGLLDPVLNAARQDPNLQSALFDAISARTTYRQVLIRTLHPNSILAIMRVMI